MTGTNSLLALEKHAAGWLGGGLRVKRMFHARKGRQGALIYAADLSWALLS